jgi:hypothetical protein
MHEWSKAHNSKKLTCPKAILIIFKSFRGRQKNDITLYTTSVFLCLHRGALPLISTILKTAWGKSGLKKTGLFNHISGQASQSK